jgi:hypothetical protein
LTAAQGVDVDGQDLHGLGIDPPDKALVLCVDEKSQASSTQQPV